MSDFKILMRKLTNLCNALASEPKLSVSKAAANSVKLTEVLTTPQGFPSFGYTYQKNPYQVYEPGKGRSPWANSNRDPRVLIDSSIREIAAELALGRFYTRRV